MKTDIRNGRIQPISQVFQQIHTDAASAHRTRSISAEMGARLACIHDLRFTRCIYDRVCVYNLLLRTICCA